MTQRQHESLQSVSFSDSNCSSLLLLLSYHDAFLTPVRLEVMGKIAEACVRVMKQATSSSAAPQKNLMFLLQSTTRSLLVQAFLGLSRYNLACTCTTKILVLTSTAHFPAKSTNQMRQQLVWLLSQQTWYFVWIQPYKSRYGNGNCKRNDELELGFLYIGRWSKLHLKRVLLY